MVGSTLETDNLFDTKEEKWHNPLSGVYAPGLEENGGHISCRASRMQHAAQ
jgi:hypothetical protein